jgi:hypothetical protein
VVIGPDNLMQSIWDLGSVPEEFEGPVNALREYVESLPVHGMWFHPEKIAGTDKSWDPKLQITWQHFCVTVPPALHDKDGRLLSQSGELRTTKEVLKRGLDEITSESIDTVIDLIAQGSLSRGEVVVQSVKSLKELQGAYKGVPAELQDNFAWRQATTLTPAQARVRNTSIGTLLVDLSAADADLEGKVQAYNRMVDPANYQRTTSIVTPRMVEDAKKTITEAGYATALHRRQLDSRDLPVTNALYVHRAKSAGTKDVFAEIAGESPVDKKFLEKVESMPMEDFIANVLPGTKGLRVLFERHLQGNLVTLTGPQEREAANLFMWDNPFGWSYAGGMASSIKTRV